MFLWRFKKKADAEKATDNSKYIMCLASTHTALFYVGRLLDQKFGYQHSNSIDPRSSDRVKLKRIHGTDWQSEMVKVVLGFSLTQRNINDADRPIMAEYI